MIYTHNIEVLQRVQQVFSGEIQIMNDTKQKSNIL